MFRHITNSNFQKVHRGYDLNSERWLLHICDMIHWNVWHDSFASCIVIMYIHIRVYIYMLQTHLYIYIHIYIYVYICRAPTRSNTCTHVQIRVHTFKYVYTHSGRRDDVCGESIPTRECVTGCMHVKTWLVRDGTFTLWHDSFVTGLEQSDMTDSCIRMSHVTHSNETCRTLEWEWVLSRIPRLCDITVARGCRCLFVRGTCRVFGA